MRPTASGVHVDTPLTNISIAYLQSNDSYVAGRVFPNVPVDKQSDRYFTFDKGDVYRTEATKRGENEESSGSDFDVDSSPTYFADVWADHSDISDRLLANEDRVLRLENAALDIVMQKIMIKKEVDFVTSYMSGGLWDNDYDGVASSPSTNETLQWDNASGTPIEDIRDAKATIRQNTGYEANTLTLGRNVYDKLVDHADIVDRIKYSGAVGPNNAAVVNRTTLAQLFEVNRVLVANAVRNTAKEGATDSMSFIVGKVALLSYAPPAPSLMTPSAGYTFSWEGYLDQTNEFGIAISRIPLPTRRSLRIEGEMAFDHKVTGTDMAFFWDSIVS